MHCETATNMRLDQREKEGIRILDLRGRLKGGDSEPDLRTAITTLVEAGVVNIILNLAEINRIDGDELEAMVFCYAQIRKRGGTLKLLHLNAQRLSLNVLTKLTTVFEVFTDERDAVDSFFPHRAVHRFDVLEWVQMSDF
jgi:anti-sigma B factor antagonist